MARSEVRVERDHAKRLLTELDLLLREAGVSKAQLAGVGVGLGPGSYTGLRVGVAAATALARGLEIALGGGSTLAAVAARKLQPNEQGIFALDARRGNVYGGVFVKEADGVRAVNAERKWDRTVLQESYPDLPYVEDGVPDASYLAKLVFSGAARVVEPAYL